MWVNAFAEPIPTHGKHGEKFILTLSYQDFYGHNVTEMDEVVIGIWNSTCECFFEADTGKEIDERDIAYWWKE